MKTASINQINTRGRAQNMPRYRATHIDFSFLRLLGLTCKEMNFYARQFFVSHIEHSNGFVRVVFVFRALLMRSIRCRDKAVRCISQTLKILKVK